MKKNTPIMVTLLGASLFFASTVANAIGVYAGIGFGMTRATIDEAAIQYYSGPNYTVDTKDNGLNAVLGLKFHRYFAMELGYSDLGNINATAVNNNFLDTYSIDMTAQKAFAVFTFPLNKEDKMFLKGGIAKWDSEARICFDTVGCGESKTDDTESVWGFGFDFGYSKEVKFRAEYESYSIDAIDAGAGDISMLGLGVIFRF